MFETRKDFKDRIEVLEAEVSKLEQRNETLTAERDEARQNASDHSEMLAELNETQEALDAEKEAHQATRNELEAEQEKTSPEAINALVTAELSKAGHPPIEEPAAEVEEKTDEKIREEFAAMPHGPERSEFFAKHRAALI